jgi:hypothetical protein
LGGVLRGRPLKRRPVLPIRLQLAALDVVGADRSKLVEIVHADLTDLAPIADRFIDVAACCFCVGISSAGVDETAYTRSTADTALEAGRTIARVAPNATFCFVSGAGTDPDSRTMWARVKGQTEQRRIRGTERLFKGRSRSAPPQLALLFGLTAR